jgi:hypothetical protein
MTINISISNRVVYSIIAFALVIVTLGIVFAYGTNNPSKFGHTASEIDGLSASTSSSSGGIGDVKIVCGSDEGDSMNDRHKTELCPDGYTSAGTIDKSGHAWCYNTDTGEFEVNDNADYILCYSSDGTTSSSSSSGGATTSQLALIGSTGIEEDIDKRVTVPSDCKEGNVCYLTLKCTRSDGSVITRKRFYSQDSSGLFQNKKYEFAGTEEDFTNGDDKNEGLLGCSSSLDGDANLVLLDDRDRLNEDSADQEQGKDEWVLRDDDPNWDVKLYSAPAYLAP